MAKRMTVEMWTLEVRTRGDADGNLKKSEGWEIDYGPKAEMMEKISEVRKGQNLMEWTKNSLHDGLIIVRARIKLVKGWKIDVEVGEA